MDRWESWLAEQGFDWVTFMEMGAVLDLTEPQREALHSMFDQDVANPALSAITFMAVNGVFRPEDLDPQYPKFNDKLFYLPGRTEYAMAVSQYNEIFNKFSGVTDKTFAEWYPENNLYSWEFSGPLFFPAEFWPRRIGVTKNRKAVWIGPNYDELQGGLWRGYPQDGQELNVYHYNPDNMTSPELQAQNAQGLQLILLPEDQRVFVRIPGQSSLQIIAEISKTDQEDIIFRGIFLSIQH